MNIIDSYIPSNMHWQYCEISGTVRNVPVVKWVETITLSNPSNASESQSFSSKISSSCMVMFYNNILLGLLQSSWLIKGKRKKKTMRENVNCSSFLMCHIKTVILVFRPLKRDQDIGSDTDFTQSSMEDINARCSRRQEDASICDHRSQEQKHYRAGTSQPRRPVQCKV